MTCFAVKYFDLDPFWPCQPFPKEHMRKYGPDWIGKTWTGLIKHGRFNTTYRFAYLYSLTPINYNENEIFFKST